MIHYLPLDEMTRRFQPALSQAVDSVVQGGRYLNGPHLSAFEQAFAAYVGAECCVGVGNGLDALTLALMAMKAEYGWADADEGVVPAMTFVATALAVVRAGLRPVLCDVDDRALMTASSAASVITSRTRVLLPVHLYGQLAPMDELTQLARQHGLHVLEDAAQAHGASLSGRRAGAWGTMAAFSFYPGKNLGALGDAGAVTTSDASLARRVRMLANYGAEQKYLHTEAGVNSRMDELQAAVLQVKLPTLDADNACRLSIARVYDERITAPSVRKPSFRGDGSHVFHIYALRVPCREAFMKHMAACGVETLIHYPRTLADQPALRELADSLSGAPFTHAADWAQCEVSLPLSPLLTVDDVNHIVDAVNAYGD